MSNYVEVKKKLDIEMPITIWRICDQFNNEFKIVGVKVDRDGDLDITIEVDVTQYADQFTSDI